MNTVGLLVMSYLSEGYKEASSEFSLEASPQLVSSTIASYRDLVNRNQVQSNERNIDWWRKQGWESFRRFVNAKSQIKSMRQEKSSESEGESIVYLETPKWLILTPLDKEASCFHGKHTDWCTTKPFAFFFEHYLYTNNVRVVYFLKVGTSQKWALACFPPTIKSKHLNCFDTNNNLISIDEFKQQTGFDPEFYWQKVFSDQHQPKFDAVQNKHKDTKEWLASNIHYITHRNPEFERALWFVKDINLMVQYATKVGDRWDRLERMLLANANDNRYVQHAEFYRDNVLGGKWPELDRLLAAK